MTRSIYFPKRAKREFSFAMGGWSSETGEASSFLQYWVSAFDKEHGLGTSNYGGYDNPAFDQVFKRALVTVDPAAREAAAGIAGDRAGGPAASRCTSKAASGRTARA